MEVDAEGFERLLPKWSHVINMGRVARGGQGKPVERVKAVVQSDAYSSGHMVVASANFAQIVWCARNELRSRNAGKNTQSFERAGYIGTLQTVKVMLPLMNCPYEMSSLEAMQVNAGGGGSDASHDGKLRAGARVAVHEAVKHAGTCGFADGRGDGRNGGIGVSGNIHTLMVDEVLLRDKGQTDLRGPKRSQKHIDEPARSPCGPGGILCWLDVWKG
jgi:hypothetical protein